jgi:hypothetical protein
VRLLRFVFGAPQQVCRPAQEAAAVAFGWWAMTAPVLAERVAKNGVRTNLTGARTRGVVENREFAGFARRILRAFSRRVAQGDVEALADLLALAAEVNQATQDAVDGLRRFGYSWSEIARRAGITKQTAQERWGTAREPKQAPNVLQGNTNGTGQGSLFDVAAGGEL